MPAGQGRSTTRPREPSVAVPAPWSRRRPRARPVEDTWPAASSRAGGRPGRACGRRSAPPLGLGIAQAAAEGLEQQVRPRRHQLGPSSAAVAREPMGTTRRANTGPVSRPSSSCIRHTPVSRSPASSARSTGAAPATGVGARCTFTIATRSRTGRRTSAVRHHHAQVGTEVQRLVDPVDHGQAEVRRCGLHGLGTRGRPGLLRPRVTTAATSQPAVTSASRGGTAIAGVPR